MDDTTEHQNVEPTEAEFNAAKALVLAAFDKLRNAPPQVGEDPFCQSVYLAGVAGAFNATGHTLAAEIALVVALKNAAMMVQQEQESRSRAN